jgi:hypothetical protein
VIARVSGGLERRKVMGVLIAKRYPTKLFADLADHTYVECGTGGRGWSCWGGKTGGSELRRGNGSTLRADQIAGANERGGITCYLVNGVCHQAANRILLPASITVRGARGYEVSEALFGTYGRPSGAFGLCQAPFDQHAGTVGDLPACIEPASAPLRRRGGRRSRSAAPLPGERRYLNGVLAIYNKARAPFASAAAATRFAASGEIEEFVAELFMHQVNFKLGSGADRTVRSRLDHIRRSTERSRLKIEEWYVNKSMTGSEFVTEFDRETVVFQQAAAGAIKAAQYKKLFGVAPGVTVTLADPRIVKRAFKR